jgi:predicted secreted hydrolase
MRKLLPFLFVIALALTGCASQGAAGTGTAFAAADAGSYAKLGLSPTHVEPWEDGMRTTGGAGSYEWWYFDFTLEDGTTVVIVYYTKNFTQAGTPLAPFVTFQMDRPDGTSVSKTILARPEEFTAAKDRCDVTIGASTVRGDLTDYTLHVQTAGMLADLVLHRTVPSWRPGTGYMTFQRGTGHYFAWLPSVPQGTVAGTITTDGVTRTVQGVGYHDHNWGDVSMLDLIHDWYWGRAQVGPYTIIASYITARSEYGSTPVPLFMLARDGEIVAQDATKVRFTAGDVYTDPFTGKPVANIVVYEFDDATSHYRVTFHRERDINRTRFVDALKGGQALMARLAGFDGAYLRFTGSVTIERFDGAVAAETESEKAAVWELMYFGHAPAKGP